MKWFLIFLVLGSADDPMILEQEMLHPGHDTKELCEQAGINRLVELTHSTPLPHRERRFVCVPL